MKTMNHAWRDTAFTVMEYGDDHSPRGKHTKEILGHQVIIDMMYPILAIPDRELSFDFMRHEAGWILAGFNDLATISKYAPSMGKFSDNGLHMSGAYGPKIVDQIAYVVDTLRDDPQSRQAVINIWRENPRPSKDIPCTLSVQFLIRDHSINTVVTMRSSDVWLGLPYDVFTFTMLTVYIGMQLESCLHLGKMIHMAGSRHIYAPQYEKAKACIRSFDHNGADEIMVSLPDIRECIQAKHFPSVLLAPSRFPQIAEKFPWLTM